MKAWYFPAWNRKKNSLVSDFRVEAETREEAVRLVCAEHAADWIIGDCRHCHYV